MYFKSFRGINFSNSLQLCLRVPIKLTVLLAPARNLLSFPFSVLPPAGDACTVENHLELLHREG